MRILLSLALLFGVFGVTTQEDVAQTKALAPEQIVAEGGDGYNTGG